MQFLGGPPYSRRPGSPPTSGLAALASWLGFEFAGVERGTARATSRTVTSSVTATIADGLILCNATTAPITVTLPAPKLVPDLALLIKKIDASANAVTLSGTVDGAVNPTLATQWKAKMIWSDGAAWYCVATV